MNIYKAKTLDEALALTEKGAKVLAGGTNLFVDLKKNGRREDDFVDISALAELKMVSTGTEIRIGALITFADILRQLEGSSALYRAAYEMGSPQVRNRATIGGNLCDASPACDAAPALLVLGARVILRSARGSREVPMDGFFKGYRQTEKRTDEILTEIVFPRETGRSVFRKVGLRSAMAISVVSLAAAESGAGVRLAMGSVAETPVRLTHCERMLTGSQLSSEELRAALAADIRPVSDIRASAEYRFETAFALLCDVLGKEYGYEIG